MHSHSLSFRLCRWRLLARLRQCVSSTQRGTLGTAWMVWRQRAGDQRRFLRADAHRCKRLARDMLCVWRRATAAVQVQRLCSRSLLTRSVAQWSRLLDTHRNNDCCAAAVYDQRLFRSAWVQWRSLARRSRDDTRRVASMQMLMQRQRVSAAVAFWRRKLAVHHNWYRCAAAVHARHVLTRACATWRQRAEQRSQETQQVAGAQLLLRRHRARTTLRRWHALLVTRHHASLAVAEARERASRFPTGAAVHAAPVSSTPTTTAATTPTTAAPTTATTASRTSSSVSAKPTAPSKAAAAPIAGYLRAAATGPSTRSSSLVLSAREGDADTMLESPLVLSTRETAADVMLQRKRVLRAWHTWRRQHRRQAALEMAAGQLEAVHQRRTLCVSLNRWMQHCAQRRASREVITAAAHKNTRHRVLASAFTRWQHALARIAAREAGLVQLASTYTGIQHRCRLTAALQHWRRAAKLQHAAMEATRVQQSRALSRAFRRWHQSTQRQVAVTNTAASHMAHLRMRQVLSRWWNITAMRRSRPVVDRPSLLRSTRDGHVKPATIVAPETPLEEQHTGSPAAEQPPLARPIPLPPPLAGRTPSATVLYPDLAARLGLTSSRVPLSPDSTASRSSQAVLDRPRRVRLENAYYAVRRQRNTARLTRALGFWRTLVRSRQFLRLEDESRQWLRRCVWRDCLFGVWGTLQIALSACSECSGI